MDVCIIFRACIGSNREEEEEKTLVHIEGGPSQRSPGETHACDLACPPPITLPGRVGCGVRGVWWVVRGAGCGVRGAGFGVRGAGGEVQDAGCWVRGVGCRV